MYSAAPPYATGKYQQQHHDQQATTHDPLLEFELGLVDPAPKQHHPPPPGTLTVAVDDDDTEKHSDDEGKGAFAKVKALNKKTARHPVVRRVKTVIFFFMAAYALFATLLEFADTFQKHPEFSTEHGEERCIPRFYQAEEFAEKHGAAIAGFWVAAGTKRIAICANATDDELDAEFRDMSKFDPLELATGGECSLDSATNWADAADNCIVDGDSNPVTRAASCRAAFRTDPQPRGVGWSYAMKPYKKPKSSNRPSSNTSSTPAPTLPPTNLTGRCATLLTTNDEMPSCPYGNVRFYEHIDPFVAALYITSAVWAVVMVVFEVWCLRQFTDDRGMHFGDLTYLVAPFDGAIGAFYAIYRVVKRYPELSELPDPSWLQFARAGFGSVLGFAVSVTAMYGCSILWNKVMLVLLIFSLLKFTYDTVSYLRGRLCPKQPEPEDPMSPTRHQTNNTPMNDDDKEGIMMYKDARRVLRTHEGGRWNALLHQFACSNDAQRRQQLSSLFESAGAAYRPTSMRRPGDPKVDEFAPGPYTMDQVYVICRHAVEAERPQSGLKQLCFCFFKKTVVAFPQWVQQERQRINNLALNKTLDAHLVRRRLVVRIVVLDLFLQALQQGPAPPGVPLQQAPPPPAAGGMGSPVASAFAKLDGTLFGSPPPQQSPSSPPQQQQQYQQPPPPQYAGQPQYQHPHHHQHQPQYQQAPAAPMPQQATGQQQHYQPQQQAPPPQQYAAPPPPTRHHHASGDDLL